MQLPLNKNLVTDGGEGMNFIRFVMGVHRQFIRYDAKNDILEMFKESMNYADMHVLEDPVWPNGELMDGRGWQDAV